MDLPEEPKQIAYREKRRAWTLPQLRVDKPASDATQAAPPSPLPWLPTSAAVDPLEALATSPCPAAPSTS